MKTKEIIKTASELAKPFRISKGENFRLKDVHPDDTLDFTKEADKPRAKEALAMGLPNRGHIGIFNRSYYEEVLVVRVHPEFLAKQKLPTKLVGKKIWEERFEDIRNFEQYLSRNGVVVRKFFLNVSKKEQKRRFLERIDDPLKNWKFSSNDANERDFWDDYMEAYEQMIQETATKDAPWYVVPADNKWFTRVVVAAAVIETFASLDLAYPKVDEGKLKELDAAKKKLLSK